MAAPPRQSSNPEMRVAAHVIGVLAGGTLIAGGVQAMRVGMPSVLGVTMLLVGTTLAALTTISWDRWSRVAWSFMFSIEVVMAIVTLFGSPKVRNILHIPLGAAMVIPIVLIGGVIALSLIADDYRGTASQKSQNAAR